MTNLSSTDELETLRLVQPDPRHVSDDTHGITAGKDVDVLTLSEDVGQITTTSIISAEIRGVLSNIQETDNEEGNSGHTIPTLVVGNEEDVYEGRFIPCKFI